jgi:N-methylhydantoinase B
MANVETMEAAFPIRYLFRRRMTDSGGPGRHRGGAGCEVAITPHDAPDGGIHYVVSGKGAAFPMSDGLSGGYPGAPNAYLWVHNDDVPDGDNRDVAFARSLDELPGRKEPVTWGVFPLMGRDALYVRWNGGGGYGDPLEREPAKIAADVADGLVSKGAAADVYGVVLAEDGRLDAAATVARRKALRAARIARAAAE